MENWLPIPGYEGLYEASNTGLVRAIGPKWKTRGFKMKDQTACPKGYLDVSLTKNGKLKKYRSHRIIAMTFIPNPQNKPQINHKNKNKKDNRVENLEWCTNAENQTHSYMNGRIARTGPDANATKLDTIQVLTVIECLRSKCISKNDIAAYFNISAPVIRHINTGTHWIYSHMPHLKAHLNDHGGQIFFAPKFRKTNISTL